MSAVVYKEDYDNIREKIATSIDKVYKLQRISIAEYMNLYQLVYIYCTNAHSREDYSKPIKEKRNSGAQIGGGDLYYCIKNYLTNYLEKIHQQGTNLDGESLLHFYVDQWERYRYSSKVLDGYCGYISRVWVKREHDGNNLGVYEIFLMALNVWKSVIVEKFYKKLTKSCLELIKYQRSNHLINTRLISTVTQSYIEIDFTTDLNVDYNYAYRTPLSLKVYKEYFENQFLIDTEQFYRYETINFLAANSVVEYLKRVDQRLDEEIHRVESYLHSSTVAPLIMTLNQVLIQDQLDTICSPATKLLDDEKHSDLALLLKLLKRVPKGDVKLQNIVEEYFYEKGLDAIKQISDSAVDDPELYVEKIFNIHTNFSNILNKAFTGEKGFNLAFERAYQKFVNNNAITTTAGTTKKSPELLVRYTDLLLRKGTKGLQQTELEEKFNQIMLIFDYINDKDFFQTFYIRLLAKRLIGHLSSLDDEEYMITQIKRKCGTEYTSKVEHMYQDIVLSETIVDQYNTQLGNTEMKDHFDFSVMVLKSNLWRFSLPIDIILPDQLRRKYDSFNKFYTDKHNGRVLTCLYQYSKGDLQTLYTKSKYTLQVSTYQMAILLLFNKYSTITVERIHNETLLPMDSVLQILRNLLKMKLLKCAEMNDDKLQGHIEDSDMKPHYTMEIDESFKSKKTKINLNVPLKTDEQKDIEKVHEAVDDDRKLVIQARLVRIMKTRQSLKHGLLLQETIQQLISRFQPKIPIIKRCIDGLIEEGYLRRDSKERDLLYYVA